MALIDNCIHYYKHDSGATDSAGANDGTVSGATNGTGFINNDYLFDGVNDEINLGNISGLDGGTAFTINAWIKNGLHSTEAHIVSKWRTSSGQRVWAMWINSAERLGGYTSSNGTTTEGVVTGATGIGTSEYVMATLVYDGGSSLKIYLNNTLDGTDNSVSASLNSETIDCFTGKSANTGSDQRYFKGHIDEVGIWNRVLTAQEMSDLYASGVGLQYPFSAGPTNLNVQLNIGDVWKEVPAMKINIGDSWKEVVAVKVNIGDVWKDL